jgi:hypothetical protein
MDVVPVLITAGGSLRGRIASAYECDDSSLKNAVDMRDGISYGD